MDQRLAHNATRTAPGLLISVRNAAEAAIACRYPVDVIDVKEPANGPLGRASDVAMQDVARVVAGPARRQGELAPVPSKLSGAGPIINAAPFRCAFPLLSVALGELNNATSEGPLLPSGLSCAYVKFGMSGLCNEIGDRTGWIRDWRSTLQRLPDTVAPVAVIYGDHAECGAPDPFDVIRTASEFQIATILFDTFNKCAGRNIFDYLGKDPMHSLVSEAKSRGITVALAGSITLTNIEQALDANPDLIGVRGAVCKDHRDHVDEKLLQSFVYGFRNLTHATCESGFADRPTLIR